MPATSEWDKYCFCRMENLEKMFETGLYINDLSMHDSSRDLLLAGTQQQAELKMALDQVNNTQIENLHVIFGNIKHTL